MYCMMYFDVEDFLSAPDAPVHQLPGQMAEIMTRHGLPGSFHIMGEKARFMERHGQTRVIEAIRKHDMCLHHDRGSIHPTTAEEVSHLNWFQGVDRVLFREFPGFQTIERVFGKCSALTQHGATFSAQAVYAAGKMGKPYFFSPFSLPGRNVVWFCNNLLIGGGEGGNFDREYKDDAAFEEKLEAQNAHLRERMGEIDVAPLFGCHPLITIMEEFPCGINFLHGARTPPDRWEAPTMVEGVSIEKVLANFERRIRSLAEFDGLDWTTTGGIADLYRHRPVRVSDHVVVEGAEAVVRNQGPAYTDALTAGELLCLLARRKLAPAAVYDVPQVMGPVEARAGTARELDASVDMRSVSLEIVEHAWNSGYLPEGLSDKNGRLSLEAVLALLACDAADAPPTALESPRLAVHAIPGVTEAAEAVSKLKDWRIHEPDFGQENISKHFAWQAWTLKPAFRRDEYAAGLEVSAYLNPALPFALT